MSSSSASDIFLAIANNSLAPALVGISLYSIYLLTVFVTKNRRNRIVVPVSPAVMTRVELRGARGTVVGNQMRREHARREAERERREMEERGRQNALRASAVAARAAESQAERTTTTVDVRVYEVPQVVIDEGDIPKPEPAHVQSIISPTTR